MKLATLAYEVVRDAIEFPSGFNKDGFVRGDYDEDRDFSSQISFAFNYINLAITRLVTLKKTILKVTKKAADGTGYIEFGDGEITAVFSDMSRDYKKVHFREFSDGIAVERDYVSKVVCIEYRPNVPHFSLEDIRESVLDEDNQPVYQEVEIELKNYGITDDMCSYIKEYAKGGLMEYLSPDLSQKHMQMAESYFASLKTRYTDYPQREVEDRLNGGGAW